MARRSAQGCVGHRQAPPIGDRPDPVTLLAYFAAARPEAHLSYYEPSEKWS